jgi:DNA polymerase III delta prime subunit
MICDRENVRVADDRVFEALVDISAGDLRRSINTLQTASSFRLHQLTTRDIESISGVIPDEVIKRIDRVVCSTDGFSEV